MAKVPAHLQTSLCIVCQVEAMYRCNHLFTERLSQTLFAPDTKILLSAPQFSSLSIKPSLHSLCEQSGIILLSMDHDIVGLGHGRLPLCISGEINVPKLKRWPWVSNSLSPDIAGLHRMLS